MTKTNQSAFEDVLASLIGSRGHGPADEERDEILETIAGAYKTFENQ
jgi:hypothetical protein